MQDIYVKFIISVVFIIFFISIFTYYISIFPPRHITKITPTEIGMEYEQTTLNTSDKVEIDAWFIPNKNSKKAIILSHGYPFDKGNIIGFAEFLHPQYNLLFFDFRHMGKSKGAYTTVGYKEQEDLNAAIKFLKNKNLTKIGGLGFSMGASTMIMSENKELKSIVADSPFANLELMLKQSYRMFGPFKWPFVKLTKLYIRIYPGINIDKITPLTEIKTHSNILLIHGKKDSQIPYENSEILNKANPKTKLWLIEDADHGQAHFLNKEEYEKRVLKFFNETLK